MKKYSLYIILNTLFFLFLICVPVLLHAQGADPGCDTLDPACPIDGGLIFLLAAGAGYGVKKIKNSRKKDAAAL